MSFMKGQQVKPEKKSRDLLGVSRSKAKMIEYGVPDEHHIQIRQDPTELFTISICILGDLAAAINRGKIDYESLAEQRENLLFSARFFDSYLQSKLNIELDPYLILLGSASYYLCDLPGSASVLANRIGSGCPNLNGSGLEDLLLGLLQGDLRINFEELTEPYGKYIKQISVSTNNFFNHGTEKDDLLAVVKKLRESVYEIGTPRQLLFGDIIAAILRKKIENCVWTALPSYSGVSRQRWNPVLRKESFIRELWPAQHLLGKSKVFKGESAIVQLPTSAGKTKALELIIRSAFLNNNVKLAVVVAPFRALCHEIKDNLVEAFHDEPIMVGQLSEVLQPDYDIAEILRQRQILVVTPEKLLYVIRSVSNFTNHIGSIVFDEGHQIDKSKRGVTYELLLTTLRSLIPKSRQKILASAVISNPEELGKWLNGNSNVIRGTKLIPTFRTVGFTSWSSKLGRIEYVSESDADKHEFYVPRVIQQINLGRRGKERKNRHFPEKNDKQAIALYLGIKLCMNGGIGIFCGTKPMAMKISEKAADCIERGLPFKVPKKFANIEEVERLHHLHVENLGAKSSASKSAEYGIFSHHGNIPHGIRLSIEHAMRKNLVRFVICTSTLAQGVNLPIRYLIVESVYQGIEQIKARDFHNLIGRVGRAGMHTEGTILFADPKIYDYKNHFSGKRHWDTVKKLLDPDRSEDCTSSILQFIPLSIRNDKNKSADRKEHKLECDIITFAKSYIRGRRAVDVVIEKIVKEHGENGFTKDSVESQFQFISFTLSSIESFLLTSLQASDDDPTEESITNLARQTLAYFLANEDGKVKIEMLFNLLAKNISENIADSRRRKAFCKSHYGVNDAKEIEKWVQENVESFSTAQGNDEILSLIWPLFSRYVYNKAFQKFSQKYCLIEVTKKWISGVSFYDLLQIAEQNKSNLTASSRSREIRVENIVDICENGISYDGTIVVNALCEFFSLQDITRKNIVIEQLLSFQKCLKYGLPTKATVALYELGFSDRIIAQDISASLNLNTAYPEDAVIALRQDQERAVATIKKYPSYFQHKMNEILQ